MSGSSSHGGNDRAGLLRQFTILAVLFAGVFLLHQFADRTESRFDPTALLALGFVVLASYKIGALLGVFKLPHITGYLVAGVLFGPSIAALLGVTVAPFDEGILNNDVQGRLSLFNTLALGLIALSAGGELHLEELRKGLRAIVSLLAGQFIATMLMAGAFFYAIAGGVELVTLDGLSLRSALIPMALALASVAFATSPAATVAVINETGAKGPASNTILSTVVLKDVVVVLAFAIFSTLAGDALGVAVVEGGLGLYLLQHILGSIVCGALLGGAVSLYLRFVGKELLLFTVGIVFTASVLATSFHLDPLLLFLATGFVVSNFSKHAHALLGAVDKVAMPVYVVFFTLTGAHLALGELVALLPYAIALAVIRGVAFFIGTRVGGAIGRAPEAVRRHGWMGFISQAGVAIALSELVGNTFAPFGSATLRTVLIGGIAIHEVAGPILLKLALTRSGETADAGGEEEASRPTSLRPTASALPEWLGDPEHANAWGDLIVTRSAELNRRMRDLEEELRAVVRDTEEGPLANHIHRAESFYKQLRRDFLRGHRRLAVLAKSDDVDAESFSSVVHAARADLAKRWRAHVLSRATQHARKSVWSPSAVAGAIDDVIAILPERIEAPFERDAIHTKEGDASSVQLRRRLLRVRSGLNRTFGLQEPRRRVDFRGLASYHLAGSVPVRLEALAALLVQADRHVMDRSRAMLDASLEGWDRLANVSADRGGVLEQVRVQLESDFKVAGEELDRMKRDASYRCVLAVAKPLEALKQDVTNVDGPELPLGVRASSQVFPARLAALEGALGTGWKELQRTLHGLAHQVALEFELLELEAKARASISEHFDKIRGELLRRGVEQLTRVRAGIAGVCEDSAEIVASVEYGDQLLTQLSERIGRAQKDAADAVRVISELRDSLTTQDRGAPLVEALGQAAAELSPRYTIASGALGRGEMRVPNPLAIVEIPFREVVVGFVEVRAAPALYGVVRDVASQLIPTVDALVEVERLYAFGLELAQSELEILGREVVPDDVRALLQRMVVGQLERSSEGLATLSGAATWPDDFSKASLSTLTQSLTTLRDDLVDGASASSRVSAIRKDVARRDLLRRAQVRADRVRRVLEHVTTQFLQWSGLSHLVPDWSTWLRSTPEVNRGAALRFMEPVAAANLSPVYVRLFAPDTMEAVDVLVGREDIVNAAASALQREKSRPNKLRATALIGHDGVGKATVSAAIVRRARYRNAHRVKWSKPATESDIDALFERCAAGSLVVIDGLQWALSSGTHAFETFRYLVHRIATDAGERAWLIHVDPAFWNYAKEIAPLDTAFPYQYRLEPLGRDALQSAVMARHRLSGLGHAFVAPDKSDNAAALFAERSHFDRYFDTLHRMSGGRIRDALRLWLASIQAIRSSDEVVVLGALPDVSDLQLLPTQTQHLLYVIVRQGWMRAEELATLLCIPEADAHARLARLLHLGLLARADDNTYRISVFLRGALTTFFHEKGWLRDAVAS